MDTQSLKGGSEPKIAGRAYARVERTPECKYARMGVRQRGSTPEYSVRPERAYARLDARQSGSTPEWEYAQSGSTPEWEYARVERTPEREYARLRVRRSRARANDP